MAAPIGNRFWELRSSHGRKLKFENSEDLWNAACEYFEWVEQNPLYDIQPFAYQGEVKQEKIPKIRAMTITGLCIFLDIAQPTWLDYKSKQDFSMICCKIEDIIRTQKFEGAAAGLLNHAIIARDLGLRDSVDSEINTKFTVEITESNTPPLVDNEDDIQD